MPNPMPEKLVALLVDVLSRGIGKNELSWNLRRKNTMVPLQTYCYCEDIGFAIFSQTI
jgi:hypothetical protein